MLAYTYIEQGKFELREKPIPEIQDSWDAIVRVTLGSICSSDLHIKHGSVPRAVPGITVGHEMVGVVEKVGADVTVVKPGDRVTVNVETFCGECFFCRRGYVNNCTDPNGGWALGCRIDGGQAEYVRVPYADRGLNHIPDTVSDEQALLVGDVLATGFCTLGFSGHSYTTPDREYCMTPGRTALYRATIAKLKNEYRGKVDILCGIECDTEFKCNVTFDVLPEIEFPNYEGLEVDQAKADVSDDDVNEIIENLRGRMAELTEVTEDRLPQDGDTVDVDYSGTDEEGNKIDDVQGENFGVALGQGQALPDFEALVKTAKVGEEKTGPVNFPADYPHKPLAGKTVIFTVKVNKIQTSQKPEVNEEFAQKVGQESLEKMKASIVEHVSATKAQAARSEAMKKLIDGLLEKVSFEIPDSMLNARVERVVQEQAMKLQRMGLDDLRKDQAQEEKREEAKKEALETLRPQVFLMALAQKENITVNDQEVEMAIYGMAMRAQQDYKKVSEAYHKSGLIYELRDRILADKALEMVYSKAKINEVPAVSLSEPKNAD